MATALLAEDVAEEDCLSHRLRILMGKVVVCFLFRRFRCLRTLHLPVAHRQTVAEVVEPHACRP